MVVAPARYAESAHDNYQRYNRRSMPPEDSQRITQLLKAWSGGDESAFERLTPLVYARLRRLAWHYVRRERVGQTLQGTALVHELYLRLLDASDIEWQDRAHFYAVAANVMRRILVDAARTRSAAKRGGQAERVDPSTVDLEAIAAADDRATDICALDDALTALAALDPRRAKVIELRFFGGLTVEETAEALDVSPQTVMRDWKTAKTWLARELQRS
jgi:RNA polymerase sigma factor (TIGR02999 family)